MRLLFLYGPPGVGKLAVATKVAARTDWKLFHNHLTVDLLTGVFEFGSPAFVELREQIWLGVFREAAATNQNMIFTFAPERTVRPSFIRSAIATIEGKDGSILFVELSCTTQELERRLASPSRHAYGKLASVEHLRELERQGAFVFDMGVAAWLSIDTTHLSADGAAALIVDRLREHT